MIRLLGPADGIPQYEKVPPSTIQEQLKAPRPKLWLVEPEDDRLIYRFGDGYNHGFMFTFLFKDCRVVTKAIQMGY